MVYKDKKDFEVTSLAAAAEGTAHIKKGTWRELLSCQHKQPLPLSLFPCTALMAKDQIPFRVKGSSQAEDAAYSSHHVLLTRPQDYSLS